ncbi:MAG: hypothetical protein PHG44_04825 [Lentisphaeria bacterium]|nr:hypothetical protein [Lentisphaeria bacterium]MDY0175585.1 hypothetical protein [Lentisphaeria bacterium]
MQRNYYLSVFPMEALIASQLEPAAFASYMAIGARKGSAEALIFIRLTGEAGPFAWKEAEKHCCKQDDGQPKHSFYLSIYRVLENMPLSALGSLYLTTRDGRCLELEQGQWQDEQLPNWQGYGLYKELCPIMPLVVSNLKPADFAAYMTSADTRTNVPSLLFCDFKLPADLKNLGAEDNGGRVYNEHIPHLLNCLEQIQKEPDKYTKIVDRTYFNRCPYGLIDQGLFLGRGEELRFWPMPGLQQIKEESYDWGRSANIL